MEEITAQDRWNQARNEDDSQRTYKIGQRYNALEEAARQEQRRAEANATMMSIEDRRNAEAATRANLADGGNDASGNGNAMYVSKGGAAFGNSFLTGGVATNPEGREQFARDFDAGRRGEGRSIFEPPNGAYRLGQVGGFLWNVSPPGLALNYVQSTLDGRPLDAAMAGVGLLTLGGGGLLGVGERSIVTNSAEALAARRAYLNEKFGRTGNLDSDITLRGYMSEVERLNVSSGYGEAVFYSGPGNRLRAENFSRGGGITLESTPGGAWLENQALFKRLAPEQAILPWERLSQRYTQGASGPVNVFIDGANPRGVFTRIELPALYSNPNVPVIIKNGVQPIRTR